MKYWLMTALILSGLAAQADGDQETVILKCHSAHLVPDNSYTISLSEGGITGHLSLRVENSTFVGLVVRSYFVDLQPAERMRNGAPVVYSGGGARLSLNYTVAPIQGGIYSTLEEDSQGGHPVELACKRVSR